MIDAPRARAAAEGEACAHRTVLYVIERESSGLTKGWWECKLCRAPFVKADAVEQAEEEVLESPLVAGCTQMLHSRIISDSAMTSSVQADRIKRKLARASANPDLALLDFDLSNEVGQSTPPVKIYRLNDTGELVLRETMTATAFRQRVLESLSGRKFQERIKELQRKRMRAGQRAKARSRAAKVRLEKARI